MKSNTIYLVAVILSVIFIAILAICLALIKPNPKYKDSSEGTDKPSQRYKGGNKQSNKYDSDDVPDYDDYSPFDIQRDQRDDNSYYSGPKSKPKSYPKSVASFSENCVVYHNKYRSKHRQTNAVIKSQKLTDSAQRKADLMARTDDFNHTPNLDVGENLWYFRISKGSAQLFAALDCYRPSKAWYDEERVYEYRSPTQSSGVVGHFTQMVWRSTRQIGCGKSRSTQTNKIYVVCHYSPSGNIIGSYPQNVFPKITNN